MPLIPASRRQRQRQVDCCVSEATLVYMESSSQSYNVRSCLKNKSVCTRVCLCVHVCVFVCAFVCYSLLVFRHHPLGVLRQCLSLVEFRLGYAGLPGSKDPCLPPQYGDYMCVLPHPALPPLLPFNLPSGTQTP